MSSVAVPDQLAALAAARGVATAYTSADDERVEVAPDTVRAALAAMGTDVADEADARAALEAHRAAEATRLLPDAHVVRRDRPATRTLAPCRVDEAVLELEDGTTRELAVTDPLVLPHDVPLGYHRLRGRSAAGEAEATVVAAPARCPLPPRCWGLMAQLYQLRSPTSWGMGDAGDLATLAARAGAELGAGFVVCNPLHAVVPAPPVEPSPYFPSSRRFTNPLILRVDGVPEAAGLTPASRDRLAELAGEATAHNAADRIDYDAIARAKLAAFALLADVELPPQRRAAYDAYRERRGRALTDYATFCALAERHGLPWQDWPATLRHPERPEVAAARAELADRVEFHAWLQWLADEQLAVAQDAAVDAGMPIGVVHDLAVGVDPGGADAWALQDELAGTVRVGAPPDAFNQLGQDWAQPPLRPDRLAATGFAPFVDMLRSVLTHAGGVRIDHVLGLFRLYWIPQGAAAQDGTYVRYPGESLLGVLALETSRADAVAVGEDLGTVEEGVRDRLADAGVLGSRVLYFERDDDGRLARPSAYPELAMASVTTHDLPTAPGWWRDAAREHDEMAALLRAEGLVGDAPSDAELVTAMYALLARTPCRLVAAWPADAVGDVRQPNLPGTTDEYPNWRLPLAEPGPDGPRPVGLDAFLAHPGTREIAAVLADRGHRARGSDQQSPHGQRS